MALRCQIKSVKHIHTIGQLESSHRNILQLMMEKM